MRSIDSIRSLIKASLFVALLFSTQSCGDFLDVAPDQRIVLDSPEKIAELIASAYPAANYIPFLETQSDNADDKGSATVDFSNRNAWYFNDITERAQDTPDFYWQAAYNAIAAANQALQAIDNSAKPYELNALRGEALVARAYAHFMLVNIFSRVYHPDKSKTDPGIPYVKEPETVVIKEYDRKTVAYVYEQIEADLLEGLPLIDDSSFDGRPVKYHFNRAAANAFASRFYLFKQDYPKVIEFANEVFPDGNIAARLRNLNSSAYRSLEPLEMLAQYTKASEPANLLLAETSSVWGRYLPSYRYGFSYPQLEKLVWRGNVTGGNWCYRFYGSSETIFTPKFREHFVRLDPNANIGIPHNMIPLFSAEEVLFNRAEANVMMGNYTAALEDLNIFASKRIIENEVQNPNYNPVLHEITILKVRGFYQSLNLETALLTTILDFKRIEFLSEGIRWFDIIRHGLPVFHVTYDKNTTLNLGPNDPRRVFQIPQEAVMAGLELNPR